MKKQTRHITIALALSLFTAGVIASIPSKTSLLAPASLSSDSGGGGGSGSNYYNSTGWCSRTWICRDGSIKLTTGYNNGCAPATTLFCDPTQTGSCDAPEPPGCR